MLAGTGLMREGGEADYTFSTTGSPEDFATIGRRFLGSELLGASQFAGGLRHPMRLTIVGCSGSYPGPESPASCYLLEADDDGRAAPGGSCSTSATARSASCTATPTRSPSTRSSSATCTPTTASTSAATT